MASIITSGLFIFAPVIGYVSQYRDIKKTSNCDGFSNRVCLILLLSNILRCYFWIGKQFDITLLYQSIVMIIAQLLMLQLCISIKSRESVTNSKFRRSSKSSTINIQTLPTSSSSSTTDIIIKNNIDTPTTTTTPVEDNNNIITATITTTPTIDTRSDSDDDDVDDENHNDNTKLITHKFDDLDDLDDSDTNSNSNSNNNNNNNNIISGYFQKFWEWESFSSYLIFLGGYSAFFLLLTTMYLNSPNYFEYLGTLSLTIESILGLPQLIQNYKKKSTKGLSLILISTWFIGDLFKTLYFYFKDQPAQFIFCGTVQLIIDTLITLQIIYYK